MCKKCRGGSRMISEGAGEGVIDFIKFTVLTLCIRKDRPYKQCKPRSDATERGV